MVGMGRFDEFSTVEREDPFRLSRVRRGVDHKATVRAGLDSHQLVVGNRSGQLPSCQASGF